MNSDHSISKHESKPAVFDQFEETPHRPQQAPQGGARRPAASRPVYRNSAPARGPVQTGGPQRHQAHASAPQRPAAAHAHNGRVTGRPSHQVGAKATHPPENKPYHAPKKKKRSKGTIAVALLMVLAVLGTGVFALYNVIQNRIDGRLTEDGVLPVEGTTLSEFKGDHVSFLVCGLDYDTEGANAYATAERIGRTDMILYVYFNIKENKVSILQIPRDTYVGSEVRTGGTGKINSLYYCAQDTTNRMAALSTVINDQFGLPVDFYVTIDLDMLKALVEHMGSIEVYVPMDIVDPETSARLEEGWRHLKGDDLEFFLRNRNNPGYNGQRDIARLRMHQSFYSALYREFTQLTPKDLIMWMNVATYYCKSDEDLVTLSSIALKAMSLEGADITFVRPACGVASYGSNSVVSLVEEDMVELLNTYFRPDGQVLTAQDLNLWTLPCYSGVNETEITSMADVQATETPKPA